MRVSLLVWVKTSLTWCNVMNFTLYNDFRWTLSYRLAKSLAQVAPEVAGIATTLRAHSDAFKQNVPIVSALASKALRPRHWEQLSELLGVRPPLSSLSYNRFSSLLPLPIASHLVSLSLLTASLVFSSQLRFNRFSLVTASLL